MFPQFIQHEKGFYSPHLDINLVAETLLDAQAELLILLAKNLLQDFKFQEDSLYIYNRHHWHKVWDIYYYRVFQNIQSMRESIDNYFSFFPAIERVIGGWKFTEFNYNLNGSLGVCNDKFCNLLSDYGISGYYIGNDLWIQIGQHARRAEEIYEKYKFSSVVEFVICYNRMGGNKFYNNIKLIDNKILLEN